MRSLARPPPATNIPPKKRGGYLPHKRALAKPEKVNQTKVLGTDL